MLWIFSVITIVILYYAYVYLKDLKTCGCAQSIYVDRLKILEEFLLGFNVLNFIMVIFGSLQIFKTINNYKEHIMKFIMLFGIGMLLFHIYFVYTTYKFSTNIKPDCLCADTWEKYYIYLQSGLMVLIVLFTTVFAGVVAFKNIPLDVIGENVIKSYTKTEPIKTENTRSRRYRSKTRSRSKRV